MIQSLYLGQGCITGAEICLSVFILSVVASLGITSISSLHCDHQPISSSYIRDSESMLRFFLPRKRARDRKQFHQRDELLKLLLQEFGIMSIIFHQLNTRLPQLANLAQFI
ncbi:uncharacterized protein A4U43_UnF6770 [Asparagus officinalis]|uniref:Uncharacterized protein n=1 Tax=Asparagus officinalis TaxID=4686 RepID=A0A1R3L6D8_ASPOF|nr:uncharacterized protein A4U43_UnF6770 [Asparagus officinalis]